MTGRFRRTYRFYDPLVDLAFYTMVPLFFYAKVLRLFMSRDEILALPTTPYFDVVFIVTWFLMYFLVAARFMRDEFAQKIWARTASTFAYFMVFVPIVVMIIVGSFTTEIYLWFEAGGEFFDDRLDNPPPGITSDPASVTQFVMFYGMIETLVQISTWSVVLFFAIYKFYRWRES